MDNCGKFKPCTATNHVKAFTSVNVCCGCSHRIRIGVGSPDYYKANVKAAGRWQCQQPGKYNSNNKAVNTKEIYDWLTACLVRMAVLTSPLPFPLPPSGALNSCCVKFALAWNLLWLWLRLHRITMLGIMQLMKHSSLAIKMLT